MHRIIDDGRIIQIEGKGFYVEADVRRHFDTLAIIIARRRQSKRRVIALVDLREAATQSATISKIITDETNRLYSDPTDRVAIVVSTMLLKLQLERVHKQQGFSIFTSVDDATAFLKLAAALARS